MSNQKHNTKTEEVDSRVAPSVPRADRQDLPQSRHGATPGPWTVILGGTRGSFHIPEAQRHEAAHADDGQDGYSVSKANARLIAAAPDLLAELKHLVRLMDPVEVTGGLNIPGLATLNAARAAIAKAEGRS